MFDNVENNQYNLTKVIELHIDSAKNLIKLIVYGIDVYGKKSNKYHLFFEQEEMIPCKRVKKGEYDFEVLYKFLIDEEIIELKKNGEINERIEYILKTTNKNQYNDFMKIISASKSLNIKWEEK